MNRARILPFGLPKLLLLLAAGCAGVAQTAGTAPTTLALQADAVGLTRGGYSGGASLGFEAADCCSMGTYLTYSRLSGDHGLPVHDNDSKAPKHDPYPSVDRILSSGLQLGAVVPVPRKWSRLKDHLRLEVRAGLAGTPPTSVTLGRHGFAGSAALLCRLTDGSASRVGEAQPDLDLVVGYSVWTLGSESTAAGANDTNASGASLLVGLRLGAGYGIDLR